MLTLINNTSRRNDAIGLLAKRLPNPLSAEEMLRILGSTSGMERYMLIRILAPNAPPNLSAEELAALLGEALIGTMPRDCCDDNQSRLLLLSFLSIALFFLG